MNKFSLNRSLKVTLILICIILFGVVLFLGITIFRIGSALNSLNENVEVTSAAPKTSPFKKSFSLAAKDIVTDEMNKNIELNDKATKYSSKLIPSERSKFSLDGIIIVLNSELGPVRLCEIQCDDLKEVLVRINAYGKGNLSINDDYIYDSAFQLAVRINQASFGPAGKSSLLLIHQLEEDPSWLSSVIGLVKLASQVDEIVKKMTVRKNTRAVEADELMNVLRDEASSCQTREWRRTCSSLEAEIEAWIAGGALQ